MNMYDCWVCREKWRWKKQQLETARNQAKQLAVRTGVTVGIYKDYSMYKFDDVSVLTNVKIIELVSKY